MASPKTKSNGASSIFTKNTLQRSISVSPHGKFSSSSSVKSSSMSIILHREHISSSPIVRFSIDASPGGRSVTSPSPEEKKNQIGNHGNRNKACGNVKKKTCMCSPTTHPGSFRCGLHKKLSLTNNGTAAFHWNRLYARRSAMTNSVVRIGKVEGDLVKRTLACLIRPSSHQQRRRGEFQPRPSRLSVMSKAED
ncbi:hypothetical protein SSX86_033132 [Deinandra increscens subsp. villosa]|uniref:Uncharacterized protein n=1 Tax=Deinandra increscens subsp. villosa TaxID=3103831 RepID=A0AAP0C2I0_9ASTR